MQFAMAQIAEEESIKALTYGATCDEHLKNTVLTCSSSYCRPPASVGLWLLQRSVCES